MRLTRILDETFENEIKQDNDKMTTNIILLILSLCVINNTVKKRSVRLVHLTMEHFQWWPAWFQVTTTFCGWYARSDFEGGPKSVVYDERQSTNTLEKSKSLEIELQLKTIISESILYRISHQSEVSSSKFICTVHCPD